MKALPIAIAALVGLAFGAPVQADHGCNGTVTQIDAGPRTYYLDDRSTEPGELNHWLYRETNGIEGLQSGDNLDLLPEAWEPGVRDPCQHRDYDQLVALLWY